MDLESPPGANKKGIMVLVLVFLGLALVAVGAFLVLGKKAGKGNKARVDSSEVTRWCELRQEWAKKVDPLAGDIMVKSVKPADKPELDKLVVQRNVLCQDFARKLRELKPTEPALQEAEIAMVKEGKTRANISVEIDNILSKLDTPESAALRENKNKLESYIKGRIEKGRAAADGEIKAAMAKLGEAACSGIFRGPMTDEGTTGNPFVSWDELELKRSTAMRKFSDRIVELEPLEQYANRIYHEMVRKYRPTLKKCYQKAKAQNPQMSDKLGLRIRLKGSGQVATLGIEWMINRDEKILDCLLETAARWRLPKPDPNQKVVVVTVDFSTF